MISLDNISLLRFGRSPILPLMCEKAPLRVLCESLMSSMNMYYLVGYDDILFIESWYFLKAWDHFCWIHNFQAAVLFAVSFFFFLFSTILSHQSVLRYFSSGEVYAWTRIRVLPGAYIIIKSHLLLLQYHNTLSLDWFNMGCGLFTHSIIRCSSEENVSWWLFTTLCLEYSHRIIDPGLLYLNRCNCAVLYIIYLFRLGYRRYLDGGSTCMGIRG